MMMMMMMIAVIIVTIVNDVTLMRLKKMVSYLYHIRNNAPELM